MTDFKKFEAAARYWVRTLGITDWGVQIEEVALERKDEFVRARVYMNYEQRKARIIWNSGHVTTPDDTYRETPEESALHEVLHLLLNSCLNTHMDRNSSDGARDAEEHAVMRRLMNILCPQYKAPK